MGNQLKVLSIFCLILFSSVEAAEEKIIEEPNFFFKNLLMVNCSDPGSRLTFCYPDQEVNPNDYLKEAQCLDDASDSNEEITYEEKKTCYSLESGEESCEVESIPVRSECVLKDRSLAEKILECESKYQNFLDSNLGNELSGLNISFSNSVSHPEFLYNALPTTYQSRKSDILLLPDHDFGEFCNDQGEFDFEKSKKELQKIKGLISEIDDLNYDDPVKEGLKQAAGVFLDSNNLDIISFECNPNGVAHAEIVGKHYRIEKKESRPKVKVEQPEEKVSLDCLSGDVKSLLDFHQEELSKISSESLGMGIGMGIYGMHGERPKQIPYAPPFNTQHIKNEVKTLCNELEDEELHISESGVTIVGRKIPKISPMHTKAYDPKTPLPRYEKMARKFVEDLNDERIEEGIDPLDGTYILELMGIQMKLGMIKEAKSISEKVAPEGMYRAFNPCTLSYENLEDDKEIVMVEVGECEYVTETDDILEFDNEIMDLPMPFDNVKEFDIVEDGDGGFIYEEVLKDYDNEDFEDTVDY